MPAAMNIKVTLPTVSEILDTGVEIPITRRGESWAEQQGDEFRLLGREKGVYVLHHSGKIIYVGKTFTKKMSFWERLRRHTDEVSSQHKGKPGKTWMYLSNLTVPPPLTAYLMPIAVVRSCVSSLDFELSDELRVMLLEAAAIGVYQPLYWGKAEADQISGSGGGAT